MSNSVANAPFSADKAGELFDAASRVAQIFLPEFAAYFVIGRVIAGQAPELYQDVRRLLQKAEPTEKEKSELHRKLGLLANPEGDER